MRVLGKIAARDDLLRRFMRPFDTPFIIPHADDQAMFRHSALGSTRFAITVLLPFLLLAGLANTQTPPDQDLMSLSIEDLAKTKVFSASRHLEDTREAPSSVSIITSEDIARPGWGTLGDILGSLRGVYRSEEHTPEIQ